MLKILMSGLRQLLFATTCLLSFVGFGAASTETLRVGMERTYTPFNDKTAEGELAGYDVDVATGVAKLIGADLEYVCQKWGGMLLTLLANKFDLVIASMSITDKRKEKMDFCLSVRHRVDPKTAGYSLLTVQV